MSLSPQKMRERIEYWQGCPNFHLTEELQRWKDAIRQETLEEAIKKCHDSLQPSGSYFANLIKSMK
jgi:hypothetical protein